MTLRLVEHRAAYSAQSAHGINEMLAILQKAELHDVTRGQILRAGTERLIKLSPRGFNRRSAP